MDNMNEERMAKEERAGRMIKDVIASLNMSNKAVTEACLAWRIDEGEVGREWTVANLAENVLYLMAVDQRSDGDAAKWWRYKNDGRAELRTQTSDEPHYFSGNPQGRILLCNGSRGP